MLDTTKMTPLQLKIYRKHVLPIIEQYVDRVLEVESIFEKAFAECPDGDGDFRPVLLALADLKYTNPIGMNTVIKLQYKCSTHECNGVTTEINTSLPLCPSCRAQQQDEQELLGG